MEIKKVMRFLLLSLCLIMASVSSVAADSMVGDFSPETNTEEVVFSDMTSSHWAYGTIDAMCGYGLTKGYPDGSFKPTATVTCGEFVKMVATAYSSGNNLTNSKTGHWALNYYNFLEDKGVVSGWVISENELKLAITREQMAYVIAQMTSEVITDAEVVNYVKGKLSDIEGSPYKTSIVKAYAQGFLSGYPDGTFKPKGTLTRAEAAAVVARTAHIMPVQAIDVLVDARLRAEEQALLAEQEELEFTSGYELSDSDWHEMEQILSRIIEPDMNRVEKIEAVHDWMVKNIQYDNTYTYYYAPEALKYRAGVCNAYMELFAGFMDLLGIPNKEIQGTAYNDFDPDGGGHAWNLVALDDGKYYLVDVTWDDPLLNGTSDYKDGRNLRYTYFLRAVRTVTNHVADTKMPSSLATEDYDLINNLDYDEGERISISGTEYEYINEYGCKTKVREIYGEDGLDCVIEFAETTLVRKPAVHREFIDENGIKTKVAEWINDKGTISITTTKYYGAEYYEGGEFYYDENELRPDREYITDDGHRVVVSEYIDDRGIIVTRSDYYDDEGNLDFWIESRPLDEENHEYDDEYDDEYEGDYQDEN